MWRVFNSLNRTAAGSLRSSVREEKPTVLVTTAQLSTVSYGSPCTSPLLPNSSRQPGRDTASCPATTGQHHLFDAFLTGICPPTKATKPKIGLRTDDSKDVASARGRPVRPFLVFPEELAQLEQARRTIENSSTQAAPMLGGRTSWEKQHKQNEELDCWNFAQLVQYSSLLTAGYNIFHKQDLDWRQHILPQSSCPALVLRNKFSVQAQPLREEDESVRPSQLHPREESQRSNFTNNKPGDPTVSPGQLLITNPPQSELKQTQSNCDVTQAKSSASRQKIVIKTSRQTERKISRNEVNTGGTILEAERSSSAVDGKTKDTIDNRPRQASTKVRLTAAEQFELELGSIRGIQMLEIGDPKGIRLLKHQCVRGSSVAAFYLGMAHEQGRAGLAVSLSRARRYYELAAGRGNAEAKYNLAVFHQQGLGGLAASEAEAGQLLAEAAAEGVMEARRALGLEESINLQAADLSPSPCQVEELFQLGRNLEAYGDYLSSGRRGADSGGHQEAVKN